MESKNGRRFDGAPVQLVQVFLTDDENRMAWHLHHHNCYAIGVVLEFMNERSID